MIGIVVAAILSRTDEEPEISMYLVYIDDSRDERLCAFSALAVHQENWRTLFTSLRDYRRSLNRSDGIYLRKELHAWEFVSGRGNIAKRVVPKARRREIFVNFLQHLGSRNELHIFNCLANAKEDERAFEYLLNRINRTMDSWGDRAILICDEGKEAPYTRLARRMSIYNPIPSRFGIWLDSGTAYRNVPIDRIVEDPFFKDSRRSYLIQASDFCAYSLLRFERPLGTIQKFGLEDTFHALGDRFVREASTSDPLGIIRVRPRRK